MLQFLQDHCIDALTENPELLNPWFYPIDPSESIDLEEVCKAHIQLFDNDDETKSDYIDAANQKVLQMFLDSVEFESYMNCGDRVVVEEPREWAAKFIDDVYAGQYEEHNTFYLWSELDRDYVIQEVVNAIYEAAYKEYNQFYSDEGASEESMLPENLPTSAIAIVDYCLVGLKKTFELYSEYLLYI